MNFGRLSHSDRLRRVDRLLADGRAYSTREIIQEAQVCAVNSIVSELRANGRDISCVRKGDVWFYRRRDPRARRNEKKTKHQVRSS